MPPLFNRSNKSKRTSLSLLSLNVVTLILVNLNLYCTPTGRSANLLSLKLASFDNPFNFKGSAFLALTFSRTLSSPAKQIIVLSLCTPSITSQVPSTFVAIKRLGTGIPKKRDSTKLDWRSTSHLNCR